MMRTEWKIIRRYFLYIILILAGFLVQISVFSLFPFFLSAPNLLLIIVFSFGFIKGKRAGMVSGLLAGLLLDLFYGELIGFYALIYMYLGYMNGICHKYYYEEYINMPLVLCVINVLAYNLYIYVFRFLFRGRLQFSYYFMKTMLPELIYTLVITLLVYRFILYINRRIEEKEKERD